MDQKQLENLVMIDRLGNVHHERRKVQKKKKSSRKKSQRKSASKKKSSKKRTSTERVPNKKSPRQRTPPQRTPSTQNTSHMDPGPSMRPNLSPVTSPRNSIGEATVVDWDGRNTSNHFEMGDSQPRVDERFITMRKKKKKKYK